MPSPLRHLPLAEITAAMPAAGLGHRLAPTMAGMAQVFSAAPLHLFAAFVLKTSTAL